MFSRMKPEKPAGVRSGFLRARNAVLVPVDEIGVRDVRPHDLQVADPVRMGDVRADGPHADRKHRPDQGEGPRTRLFLDRKSTRLNSSHLGISYAVFCLKKKKINTLKFSALVMLSASYTIGTLRVAA